MTGCKTGTCEDWLAARLDLLKAEKELAVKGELAEVPSERIVSVCF
jgi:predicted dithiol-disulfide oxidoreductase (DUF899 family)